MSANQFMLVIVEPKELEDYKRRYGKWNSERYNAMIVPLEEALTDEQRFKVREARRQFESNNPEPNFFPHV